MVEKDNAWKAGNEKIYNSVGVLHKVKPNTNTVLEIKTAAGPNH